MTSQPLMSQNFKRGSLRGPRAANTVLFRMAADQARAERIRALKEARPDLTWRRIGEAVGVSERSAVEWQKSGGIDYEHAEKLAAVFEVDLDWLWRGPKGETPNLIPSVSGQLQGVDAKFSSRVDEIEAQLDRIETALRRRIAHDRKIEDLLEQQTELLEQQTRVLEDIRGIVGREDAFDALREFAETVAPEEPAGEGAPPPARKRPARRSRASG